MSRETKFQSVVVLGPTGIGKTRLILELIYGRERTLRRRFMRARYVDLALIRNQLTALQDQPQDQELLTLSAIARQIGIQGMQDHPLINILGTYLREQRILLVLDNVEHPQTIEALLNTLRETPDPSARETPSTRIVVVARGWGKKLPRQEILSIGPLAIGEATELFAQRAADPMPLPEHMASGRMIEELCAWLQCHPLLIKLVAASHKIYDLHEIHAQIGALVPPPAEGKEAPLSEVVRLAVNHFDATQQELLAYLSIFPASFTLEAARAVCHGDETRAGLRRLLAELTEYDLARGLITATGRCYTLQDAFREHMVRYSPRGLRVARQRFVRYFLAEAERAAQDLTLPAKRAAFAGGIARFAQEYPNLRTALGMALAHDDATKANQFGAALWRYWWSTGSQIEAKLWFDQLRSRGWPYPRAVWAHVLAGAAAIEHTLGRLSQAYELGCQACRCADGAADPAAQATARIIFGAILIDYADPETRIRQIRSGINELATGVPLAQLLDDAWLEALGTHNLGRALSETAHLFDLARGPDKEPDLDAAREHLEQARKNLELSLELSRALDNTWLIATNLCWLGRVAAGQAKLDAMTRQARFDEARKHWTESRRLFESIPHALGVAQVIYGQADVAYQTQKYELADELTRERLEIETELRSPQGVASSLSWQGRLKAAQGEHQAGCALLQDSLMIYRAIGDAAGEKEALGWLCEVLYTMALVAFQERNYRLADEHTNERLEIETYLGNRQAIASCWAWQGRIKAAEGDLQGAYALLQQSLALYRKIGDAAGEAEVRGWMQEAVPFSIEGQPDAPTCWDTYTPSAIRKVNQLSSLIRMLGGFSFQELMSALQEVKKFTEYGSDLTYDFFTRPAYLHAALTGDAALLRLMFRLLLDAGIQPRSLVHDLQNHDELTFQLPELELRGNDLFEYGRESVLGSDLQEKALAEIRERAAGAHAPWNKLYRATHDGIATTIVGLIAAGLGLDPYSAEGDDLERIRKLHLLVARANAMQPGVFALSAWDLVGALPLRTDEVAAHLLAGDDYRWLNRGGVDPLGTADQANRSAGGLARARTLYGPLPAQLADESSFAWRLKQMLAARERYGIAHGEVISPPPEPGRNNTGLCILAMELPAAAGWAITALNFARKEVSQALNLPQLLDVADTKLRNRPIVDAETDARTGMTDVRGTYTLRLAALDGRTLVINRQHQGR